MLSLQTGRVAERTSSRLRRTNDRSVLKVISSDAEHVRHVSYASKRKYKLDLSSLHEDHEDRRKRRNWSSATCPNYKALKKP
ncbi:MAG: hypothetical protein ACOYK1_05605 [Vampirovibrionia bacterium]